MKTSIFVSLAAFFIASSATRAEAKAFMDQSEPKRFIELQAHGLVGMSAITENYVGVYPTITEWQLSPGAAFGVGAAANVAIREWIGVGAQFNFRINNYSSSVVVSGQYEDIPTSVMTMKNHYYDFNLPLYVTFRFNVADNVRWNVDFGGFYSLGLSGTQKQNVRSSYINDLGQLINVDQSLKVGYYRDSQAFINSFWRSDWGLHLGTSFNVGRHVVVGVQAQFGLKNVANVSDSGLSRPNVHNIGFVGLLGYRF